MQKFTLVTTLKSLNRLRRNATKNTYREELMVEHFGGKIFTKDEFFLEMEEVLTLAGFKGKPKAWCSFAFYCWKRDGAIFPVAL